MNALEKSLVDRSGNQCEICAQTEGLAVYEVGPDAEPSSDHNIYTCITCHTDLEDTENANPEHWRCLNDSIWSTVPAVQVVSYRMLNHLKGQDWVQSLLDMMYLEDDVRTWAEAGLDITKIVHKDSNGNILQAGDSVTLIKDLKVKGSSMIAKRGTTVRRISLDHENAEYIEGKVDGQRIVLITKYVKKTS